MTAPKAKPSPKPKRSGKVCQFEPPENFPEDARAIWLEYAPMLATDGRLTDQSLPLFTRWCLLWDYMQRCDESLQKLGVIMVTKHGTAYRNPAAAELKALGAEFRAICVEFLMTPKSRLVAGVGTKYDKPVVQKLAANDPSRLINRD